MVRFFSTLPRGASLCILAARYILPVIAAPVSPIYILDVNDQANIDAVIKEVSALSQAANVKTSVRLVFDSGPVVGFSFTLTGENTNAIPNQLEALPEVKTLYTFASGKKDLKRNASPQSSRAVPKDIIPEHAQLLDRQDNSSGAWGPHIETGVDKLHAAGIKGKGTRIALVDMCFDYEQEVFGGSIGPDKKITYGYNWKTSTENDVQCTCDFHGTAILGVVGANPTKYNLVGVAPEASIELHSVYSCEDQNLEDDFLYDVIRKIAARGVDVISFSLNDYTAKWPNAFAAVVFARLQANGTFMSSSSGNGRGNAFSVLSPSNGYGVPAVTMVNAAEVQNVYWNGTYSIDNVTQGQALYYPAKVANGGPTYPANLKVWFTDRFNNREDKVSVGCYNISDTLTWPNVNDTIVMLSSNECVTYEGVDLQTTFGTKYQLEYDSKPNDKISVVSNYAWQSYVGDPTIGLGVVSWNLANEWYQAQKAGKDVRVSLASVDAYEMIYDPVVDKIGGGRMNEASCIGPTFDASLAVAFAAPGGHLLTVAPSYVGGFTLNTGTSNAAPYVAGCAALVRSAHKDWDADTLRNVLALTAKPIPNSDTSSTDFGFLAPTQQQGGGLVDCYAAYYTSTVANVSSLSFNTTRNQQKTVSFRLDNTADVDVSYDLHHVPAASFYAFASDNRTDLYTPNRVDSPGSVQSSFAELTFEKSTVILPAMGSVDVTVSLSSLPQGLSAGQVPIYGGYITLNCTESTAPAESCFDLSIPYTGIAAELYGIEVLSSVDLLSVDSDENFIGDAEEGHTFNFTYTNGNITGDEFPAFNVNYVLNTQRNIFDLVNHDTKEAVIAGDYDGTGLGTGNYWSWDGTNGNNKFIPAGNYFWRVRALQMEGDWNAAQDYVELNTSHFKIAYAGNSTGIPSS